jgi:hypothetical protein
MWVTFLFGFLGASLSNVLSVYEFAKLPSTARPPYLTNAFYWLSVFLLSCLGGGLTLLYETSGTHLPPLLALNIGASAPLLMKAAAVSIPKTHQRID